MTGKLTEAIEGVLRRIAARGEDHVWISRVAADSVLERARALERLGPEGRPLFGIPFAVKDNIDVAGMATTAGCPDFAYTPAASATVVDRLLAAGAILIGKTNLDQFATGLVGTRSPYGVPANPFDPDFIPGGSSSGSAVAVASGLVGFALGTDTAGSGRVPAAFNNIVGIKPSIGLVSAAGVVPARRSLDCVSIFSPALTEGLRVLEAAAAPDAGDPFSRAAPAGWSVRDPARPVSFEFAVPASAGLWFGDDDSRALFQAAVERLARLGGRRREIDYAPFAEAAELLYSDAGVAERVVAVGDFLRDRPGSVHPVTRAVIERGRNVGAEAVHRQRERAAALCHRIARILRDVDVLALPTAGTIYRIAEIEAEPIALNTRLGFYTNFVNPMDCAAIALPAGFRRDGMPFGITLVAPAFHEPLIAGIALLFERGDTATASYLSGYPVTDLAVFGAHMRGEPFNATMLGWGARFVGECRTVPAYRLFDLGGAPARPGLVGVAAGGASVAGEIWRCPAEAFAAVTAAAAPPLAIGTVLLDDGRAVKGFVCEATGAAGMPDITAFGGWREYRRRKL